MVVWFTTLILLNTSSPATNYYSSGILLEGGGPGSAYPPDWDSSRAPLSAVQIDSVLEVAGTRFYASACSAAAQFPVETSPSLIRVTLDKGLGYVNKLCEASIHLDRFITYTPLPPASANNPCEVLLPFGEPPCAASQCPMSGAGHRPQRRRGRSYSAS